MPVEELSPEEKEFFKSGGAKEPPAETVEKPEPKVEAKEEPKVEAKAAPEGSKPAPEGEKKEEKRPPEGFVPHGAFHQERAERKRLEGEAAEMRKRMEGMESRFQQILEASKPKPPAKDQDPVAYFDYELQSLKPKLEDLEKLKTELSHKDRLAKEQQEFMNTYVMAAQQFSQTQKDFDQAYQYLARSRVEELMEVGYDLPSAHQLSIQDEQRIVAKAFQDGVNPAERMYALAKKRGYQLQAPPGEKSAAEQKLDVIDKGQKSAPEFSPASGGKPKLTLAAIADMSDEDFAKLDWERTVGKLAA
ncbi:MAG TPA: hypothetical protein VFU31_24980 [Candidatus Binatia bacterium]|nr:hypothetical protein [Candidatus Binatia bacterium]